MRQIMTSGADNVKQMGDWAISIEVPEGMFWRAAVTVVCLCVAVVESVVAIVLLVS